LIQFHEELMGDKPDDAQRLLYRANGRSFGYLDGGRDRKKLLAVILLAMWHAKPEDGETFRKVLLIIPPTHERWAVETLQALARYVLGRMADRPMLYNFVVKALQQMQIGSRILGMDEPAIWVAYGFGEGVPMPEWLQARLLRV
jgi:hypothetical protein